MGGGDYIIFSRVCCCYSSSWSFKRLQAMRWRCMVLKEEEKSMKTHVWLISQYNCVLVNFTAKLSDT